MIGIIFRSEEVSTPSWWIRHSSRHNRTQPHKPIVVLLFSSFFCPFVSRQKRDHILLHEKILVLLLLDNAIGPLSSTITLLKVGVYLN